MSGLVVSGQVFKMRTGTIGKKNAPAMFLDLIVEDIGMVNCAMYLDGETFLPQLEQKITAQVGGMRPFGSGVSLTIKSPQLQANGKPPAPPTGK